MGKLIRLFCWHKNVVPWGLSAPAPGLYTCIKPWKKLYKIRLQRHFWNLQQMNKVTRHFCWHGNFVPWGLSAPALGLYTIMKKVYKITLQRDFFETCNKWVKWSGFSVDITILSLGLSSPAPGLCTCIKSWTNLYKIRLQRYFWNLQQMNEVTRHFCGHRNFVP